MSLIERFRAWRRDRLERKAWPTLWALCCFVPPDRAIDARWLWANGGTIAGFRAAKKLGWAEYDPNRIGSLRTTEAGCAAWASKAAREMSMREV